MRNYFVDDDFDHLYNIANKGFWHFVLTPHGEHALFTRNLFFWVFYRICGLDPRPYFVSVLLTHLVNVYLLCRIIEFLTDDARLGFLGGVLWGTCPVDEGTLGWYSVYGHVLATSLGLWVLYDLLRRRSDEISRRRTMLWCGLLLVGVTCFGTGIATALALPVMALLLLPPSPQRRRVTLVLASLFLTVPLLYVGVESLYAVLYSVAANPAAEAFEKLPGWRPALEMFTDLAAYGTGSLVDLYARGDAGEITRACWWVSDAILAAILSCLVLGRSKTRRSILAFSVGLSATYGIIAAGRAYIIPFFHQSIEWGTTQPRYHYTAQSFIAVLLCLVLAESRRAPCLRRLPLALLLLGAVGTNLTLWFAQGPAIDHHDDARAETLSILATIASVTHSTPAHQDVLILNRQCATRPHVGPLENFPGWVAVFMIAHPDNTLHGHRVRFVELNAQLLANLRAQGGRITTLVLAPAEIRPLLERRSPGAPEIRIF